jgi:hypothetical protein
MNDEQPIDPFAGDPHDPVAELAALDEPADPPEPLTADERAEVAADLADLDGFRTLLEGRGVRGLVVECGSCDDAHYFAWDLLHANLRHLLAAGETRVHEPAHSPDPDDYVTWEYARGYADAVMDASD